MKPFREWYEERYGSMAGQLMSSVTSRLEEWLNECHEELKREVNEAVKLVQRGVT